MDLIDRYLVAVRRQLPAALQDDIVQELGDSLRSEAEEHERRTGHPLTADEQAVLLKKRGHPWLMASRYLPQQQLIGPALFPYYRQALKIVVFWVVLPIVLFGGAINAIYSADSSMRLGARARRGVERRHLCGRHRHDRLRDPRSRKAPHHRARQLESRRTCRSRRPAAPFRDRKR